MQNGNLIDSKTLLAAVGEDEALLQKVVHSFQSRGPEGAAVLSGAALRRDSGAIRGSAHKLRGLVSIFSTSVAEALIALEEMELDDRPESAHRQSETVAQLIHALAESLATITVDQLKRAQGTENGLGWSDFPTQVNDIAMPP